MTYSRLVACGAVLAVLTVTAAGVPPALAQVETAAAPASATERPEPLDDDELEELVARIALYPDELVALVCAASLFPLQIVEAERFLEKREKDNPPDHDASSRGAASGSARTKWPSPIDTMRGSRPGKTRKG